MTERQVIDAQGRFVGGLASSSNTNTTSSYLVVSVVGCQSGGKSTLLNAAFGTSFPVLDAPKSGRRRTTLGVWGALADFTPPLVVLDVEGTDSRERGEGAVAFQARTALLALALSDVVLVNMWAHDVGRHSAANYDLFETVFAHAPRLRKGDAPVRLVVVVRDCEPDAPVHDISRVLTGDLRNIWAALKKPDSLFDQLFKLRVVALPHKKYAPEKFFSEVEELGQSIANQQNVRPQPVPLTGFDAFSRQVWLSICQTTGGDGPEAEFTLDLPRHVALTAHFKCGEIATAVFDGPIGERLEELRAEIEMSWNKPVPEFGPKIDAAVRDAFLQYDKETTAYRGVKLAGDAVGQRRREVGGKLVEILSEHRERYLWACREFCRKGFDDDFRPMLGGTNGYERNARRLANSYVNRYRSLVEGARLPSSLNEFVLAKEAEKRKEEAESVEAATVGASGIETLDTDRVLDDGFQLTDSDDDVDVDEYSVEAFKKDLLRLVEERRRLGEIMLPGGGNLVAASPKPEPWWKGLLIRGAILLINYLQATHGQRAAIKLQRKHEKEFPPGPTF